MKFPAQLSQITTLKKGMKITIAVSDKNVRQVMKDIYNFMDMPLNVNLDIDAQIQQERLSRISPDQRNKIYAIFRDIASYTGETPDNTKEQMKLFFTQQTQHEDFSLSNCKKELANEFIEWLIKFCFEHGVELSEHPKEYIDDIERYLVFCLQNKICAVCGKPSETHHWDAIGMGRDRKKYDDSDHRKIALCRKHHSEAETIGRDTFAEKHIVTGVIYND